MLAAPLDTVTFFGYSRESVEVFCVDSMNRGAAIPTRLAGLPRSFRIAAIHNDMGFQIERPFQYSPHPSFKSMMEVGSDNRAIFICRE